MSASEAEVEELVLPGLVGKREEQPGKDKPDKVTGQRLKEINLGDDSDEDLDAEDEDVSDRWSLNKSSFDLLLLSESPLLLSCTIWSIAAVPTFMIDLMYIEHRTIGTSFRMSVYLDTFFLVLLGDRCTGHLHI